MFKFSSRSRPICYGIFLEKNIYFCIINPTAPATYVCASAVLLFILMAGNWKLRRRVASSDISYSYLCSLQSVHCSKNGNRGQVEGMVNLEAKFIVLWEESKLRSKVVFVTILRAYVLADLLKTDLDVNNFISVGFICCYNIGIICISNGYLFLYNN